MSDEFTTGEASVQETHGYEPLAPGASEPKEDESGHYGSDADGLKHAALDLENSRAKERDEPVERQYYEHGQEAEDSKTVSRQRAVTDLTNIREAEQQQALEADAGQLAQAVDQVRLEALKTQFPELAQQAQRPDIAQPQPDVTPEPVTPGIDPEISKALENPKIRAALEAEVAQIQQAQNRYAQATHEAAKLAAATMMVQFPELHGLSAQELPIMVSAIGKNNPARQQAILEHANRVQQMYNASESARAQAQQVQAQQQQRAEQQWLTEQDAAWNRDVVAKEPARVAETQKHLVEVMSKDYGISQQELMQLAKNPLVKSAAGSKILMDAISYRLAQRSAMQNPVRNVPPVQRPGVSQPSVRDDSHLAGLQARFDRTGDPRDGAKLLIAKRARG